MWSVAVLLVYDLHTSSIDRPFRAPTYLYPLPISNRSRSNLSLIDRNILNNSSPATPAQILTTCNVISSNTYDKHFTGLFGLSFDPNKHRYQQAVDYSSKTDYLFPSWFCVEFDLCTPYFIIFLTQFQLSLFRQIGR